MSFKSGFVSIIGNPNRGKSTLLNALINKQLSTINSKPNITRTRILGIYNDKSNQIIFSDTPGILKPMYSLQKKMLTESLNTIIDSDLLLVLVDIKDKQIDNQILKKIIKKKTNYIILINKIDLISSPKDLLEYWRSKFQEVKHKPLEIVDVSAKYKTNFSYLIKRIKHYLPIHPPFYNTEMISDRPIRFFIEEIIREKIFSLYQNEIPYSSRVKITQFEESDNFVKIIADIFLERESQKKIIIGHEGQALKKLGTESRINIQKFLKKKVFLKTHIKIQKNWRNDNKIIDKIN